MSNEDAFEILAVVLIATVAAVWAGASTEIIEWFTVAFAE